ncbi:aldehyde ferredoxin oxidoreductase family protein [Candidatus Alkanophaga liquidiphilum]
MNYTGKLLRINLTKGKSYVEELREDILKQYLGGKGLAAYLLFRELSRGIHPFSPENKIVISTGPLTGTHAPSAVKFCVATKSPATYGWTDGHASGTWGIELKKAGYDCIIIEGRANKPSYVLIRDGKVSIIDASIVWGASTFETMRILKDRHSTTGQARVLCIGPAGEKLCTLANIFAEGRSAGRGGVGAVMGSKNLKAIVVTGHKERVELYDEDSFNEARKEAFRILSKHPVTGKIHPEMGTANILLSVNEAGGLPTYNFRQGVFEYADEISGEAFKKHLWLDGKRRKACPLCVNKCSHLAIIEKGKWRGVVDEGPDYENIAMFGSNCGVAEREAIAVAEYLCDYYGLDGISVGNTIAFLMECYERGLIDKHDTGGLDLKFGNADAMVEAVMMTGTFTGIGKLSSLGVKKAAAKIGNGSENFAIHVKGLEVPAYDPRAAFGMGLAYARADRGACHLRPFTFGIEISSEPYTTEGKAKLVKKLGDANAAFNSLGLCLFVTLALETDLIIQMLNFATGMNLSKEDYIRIGERINNLTRAFNVREGLDRRYDTLPKRFTKEPAPMGPNKGKVVPLDPMLDEYYQLYGWDSQGVPKKETLLRLDLDFVARELG